MDTTRRLLLERRIRLLLIGFVIGLVLSGATAFPLAWELKLLASWLGLPPNADPAHYSGMHYWIAYIRQGVTETGARYPFMAYGTDWLAFAHIVIATAFIGPYREPVRNKWVIEWAMLACVLIFPLALICGPLRGIPIYWRIIDCSFGVVGIIPLYFCWRMIKELETQQAGRSVP